MSLLRVIIDVEVSDTGAQVLVNAAFLRPDLPPEQVKDSGAILRALELGKQGVLQQISLVPPSVVPVRGLVVPR